MLLTPIDVVVPAAGRLVRRFAEETGATVKALLPFNGTTLMGLTLRAVQDSGCCGRIVVVGPPEIQPHLPVGVLLPEAGSAPANIFAALNWLAQGQTCRRVLVLTADLPYVTGEVVRDFVESCPDGAAINVPVIEKAAVLARFPSLPGGYVKLADGSWTIGGAFLLDPEVLLGNREHLENIFAARKSILKMALLLGPTLAWKMLIRRAGIADIERRCADMLQCSGAAVMKCPPELAFDIDDLEDYQYALSLRH